LEVKQYIENLDSTKSTGLDGISAKILKSCGDSIVIPITSMINNSIRLGIFPDKLKEARVIPLFKSSDRSDPNNYRPISILPTISKLFERHLSKQIKMHLQQTGMIHKFQSGFREKHSCQTSLTRIFNDWLDAIDKGNYVGALFLDLRKAFDLVDHEILLYKMKLYNFSTNATMLIESYLTNRYQTVKAGNVLSSKRTIKSGVPQGSILGPILFLIYINDIAFDIPKTIIDLYADDATLYTKHKNVHNIETQLQNDLDTVSNWCYRNNMVINANKSKCMLIGSNKKLKSAKEINLIVNNCAIQNVTSHNLLGVIADSTLSWETQINSVCKKVNIKLALLKKLNYFLSDEMKMLFYNAYILPSFDYCCFLWGVSKQAHSKKILLLQKRAARIILSKPFKTPSLEMFKNLKWLTFENRCKYHTAVMVYKALNDLTPPYIKEIINTTSNERYSLRSSSRQDIAYVRFKTQYKKHSFSVYSIDVWNSLPEALHKDNTLNTFKRNCKKLLFNQQFNAC
jgi:hypothetical protein